MLMAATRPVSPSLARCELTHLPREPIDVERAARQHEAYEDVLRSLGATPTRMAAAPELPDAVFIEDTAIVLDEIAVITRPGAPSRRGETAAVESFLRAYRPVHALQAPATLDGGDVLRLDRSLYVGGSSRTNEHSIEQLRGFVAPFGYRVIPVAFTGALHLKSAVTALSDDTVLLNPAWVSPTAFPGYKAIFVDEREPYGGNALRVGDAIVYPTHFPRTRDRLIEGGFRVAEVDLGELAKAEGAVTCCSLIFEAT